MFIPRERSNARPAPVVPRVALLALLLASTPAVARGQTGDPCRVLYGVDSASDGLSLLDPESRTVTAVGPVGALAPIGVAVRPSDGRIYVWDNAGPSLMTVDGCTGQGTLLHEIGPGFAFILSDLVFSPEGRLFGTGSLLYEFDPDTGHPRAQGTVRDQEGRTVDLIAATAYAPDGRLFAVADSKDEVVPTDLGLLDPYAATFSMRARLDLPETDVPQDLVFDGDGDLYLIALRPFAIEQMGLHLIDPDTGATLEVWRSRQLPQSVASGIACGTPVDSCLQRVVDFLVDFSDPIRHGLAVVRWTTVGETGVRGFNLVRFDDGGRRTQLNAVLLPCEECVTGASRTYTFFLPRHRDGRDLFIEVVRADGRVEIYGPAQRG